MLCYYFAVCGLTPGQQLGCALFGQSICARRGIVCQAVKELFLGLVCFVVHVL